MLITQDWEKSFTALPAYLLSEMAAPSKSTLHSSSSTMIGFLSHLVLDAAQLIEHQMRQEADHGADGEEQTQIKAGTLVNEKDDQAGDEHGRDAVIDAAVHGEALEDARQAITDEEMHARQDHQDL